MQHRGKIFKVSALAAAMAVSYPLAANASHHEGGDAGHASAQTTASGAQQTAGSAQQAAGSVQQKDGSVQQKDGSVQQKDGSAQQAADSGQQAGSSDDHFTHLREKTVSAEELLGASVANAMNPVGNVRDLVLTSDGSAVQYVLYEIPYPYYAMAGTEDGFVAFDNVELQPAHTDVSIQLADDAAAQAPEQLTLTRQEADHRLISNLLNDSVTFAGDESRQVEDILIDRKTGKITGYVVNANPDSLFNDDPRVIPADQVKIGEQGDVTTQAEFAALESIH